MSLREKLLQIDTTYTEQLRIAENPGVLRNFARFLAHSGDSWFWLVALIVLWLLGDNYWKERALVMMIGIGITAIIVFVIKFTVRRRRPEGEWGAIYRKTDPHSFPSGHAARATMLAVLAIGLGPAWFGMLLAVWAPLVVLARVAMGVHFLTDVIAGALLGILIGIIVFSTVPLAI